MFSGVKGLDAVNGTPVIDIKPFMPHQDSDFSGSNETLKRKPRAFIIPLLKNRKTEKLFLESGKLHGHYCPGLAMGVMATVEGLNRLALMSGNPVSVLNSSDGMEDVISIIEINSCFADGVQFVSGCTLGNNALIFRDYGKTAVTFCLRDGKGIRVASNGRFHDLLYKLEPEFKSLFEEVVKNHSRDPERLAAYKEAAMAAGLKMCSVSPDEIFNISEVKTDLPDYAPIKDSLKCSVCGELIMESREYAVDPPVCVPCSGSSYLMLDGSGLKRGGE